MNGEDRLSFSVVDGLLSYQPDTGVLSWKAHRSNVRAGDVAGTINHQGYCVISICGRDHQAHRVAWLLMTKKWPEQDIDHINGDPSDNRWTNLRDVTKHVNQQNQRKARVDNKSGFLGVSPKHGRWRSVIHVNGKQVNLGLYDTKEAAHDAYLQAKRQRHAGCTI